MKKILTIFSFILLICYPSKANSQSSWDITDFQSDISILKTGEVAITETVSVDFLSLKKHGIYRDMPYAYQNENGEKRYTHIKILSVKRDGNIEKYQSESNSSNLRIKIGNEDKTISGRHTYLLSYIVSGVLIPYSSYDELYWNVTGSEWEVPIRKASATLTLPSPGLIQTACYSGVTGSNVSCNDLKKSDSYAVFSNDTIYPGENFTIAAGFKKGLVPILSIPRPKTFSEKLFQKENLILFILLTLFGVLLILWKWLNKGRDFWRGQGIIALKNSIKPIGAHETIVVEFTPPQNLRPAEIGALLDEKADTLDVTATLIDLAQRGFITIKEIKKTWVFGRNDYIFTTTLKTKGLLDYELLLMEKLFKNNATVKLSELKYTFYQDLASIKNTLYERVISQKLFVENPEKIRKKYFIFGILLTTLPGGIFLSLGLLFLFPKLLVITLSLCITGIATMILSQKMPRRTAEGRELYTRSLGYKMFINGAEKYRQQFFENKNLFNEVLPYAIIFGLTEKFAKAMKDIGLKPQEPTWYKGNTPFVPTAFAQSIGSMSKSLSTAIAATPSKSGSSSGGFSGGGSGGGGGGSW